MALVNQRLNVNGGSLVDNQPLGPEAQRFARLAAAAPVAGSGTYFEPLAIAAYADRAP